MSSNQEDSVMGLPTGSGKRRWPEQGEDGSNKRPKAICTSPPHALCAEDILKNHHPTSYDQAASHADFECQLSPLAMESIEDQENLSSYGSPDSPSTSLGQGTKFAAERDDSGLNDCGEIDHLSDHTLDEEDEDREAEEEVEPEEEPENFIDDEEDKDSGFIDGNSIDDSSDDDMDMKECQTLTTAPSSSTSLVSTSNSKASTSSDLQLSLSKVLPSPTSPENVSTVSLVTTFTTSVTVASSLSSSEPSTSSTVSFSTHFAMKNPVDASLTTVTAAQNGTIVTSSYQGAVTSPSYDLHNYNSTYSTEMYLARPATPSWSCNFPDGSHPTPNKYMEISPSRSHANPSIQCDENGKSYLELGSASPYTNTYTTECTNFTTTTSYNASLYTQTFSGGSTTYGQGNNNYYNTRQNYNATPYAYHNENYNTYEGDTGSSYSYPPGTYQTSPNSRPLMGSRVPQRCSSPYCDPTRTSPRPSCYQQQRLSVLNISMYKLNRYSRFPETSLHRSVLIWNTLRQIERELESEGVSMASILSQSHHYGPHLHNAGPSPETMPSPHAMNHPNEGPLPSLHSPLVAGGNLQPSPPPLPPSIEGPSPCSPHYTASPTTLSYPLPHYPSTSSDTPPSSPLPSFENKDSQHVLRPFAHPHSHVLQPDRLPPISSTPETSESDPETTFSTAPMSPHSPRSPSSTSTEERSEDINWCSVLSLSSQTDLDTMNNNECQEWPSEGTSTLQTYPPAREDVPPSWKLPSLSADDVLKSFPESSRRPEPSEDLDSLIKVLVGS